MNEQLLTDMKNCYQYITESGSQTVYEHGLSVAKYCFDFVMHTYFGKPLIRTWSIDKILDSNIMHVVKNILVLDNNHDDIIIDNPDSQQIFHNIKQNSILMYDILTYCLYHDCGKPYCRTVDCNGNTHFLNHELVSYKKWMEAGGSKFIGDLILYDMAIHRSTIKELNNMFDNISIIQWCILIISALSEVHSNAEMFGGLESISFKIKLKKIFKNVKHIIKKIQLVQRHHI